MATKDKAEAEENRHHDHPYRWHGKKRGGYFFGFFLIALGGIFLLQNLGILSGDIWGKFWPVIIIVLGGLIILDRS